MLFELLLCALLNRLRGLGLILCSCGRLFLRLFGHLLGCFNICGSDLLFLLFFFRCFGLLLGGGSLRLLLSLILFLLRSGSGLLLIRLLGGLLDLDKGVERDSLLLELALGS